MFIMKTLFFERYAREGKVKNLKVLLLQRAAQNNKVTKQGTC